MTKVGWLIDADMFHEYRDDLIDAIESLGHQAKPVQAPQPPYRWDDIGCSYRNAFPEDACVVVHGDIELVARVHQERRWTPGVFATIENFACSKYYPRYEPYLLNRDHVMLPFCNLEQQRDS